MPAPKNNQFWKLRTTHGAPEKYKAEELHLACVEYFEARDKLFTPIDKSNVSPQYGVTPHSVSIPYPYTLGSLCLFLGISNNSWGVWSRDRKDLSQVIEWVEQAIYDQKLTGASAGVYNSNIISRDLGLADKKIAEVTGSVSLTDLSDEELKRRLLQLQREAVE